MHRFYLILLFVLATQFNVTAQDIPKQYLATVATKTTPNASSSIMAPLGRPRTPLKNSFYSKYMWDFDGRQFGFGSEYVRRNFSLLGLGDRISTSGKTVVYDAGLKNLTTTTGIPSREMKFSPDAVSFSLNGKDYVIPVRVQSAPAGKNQLSPTEADLVSGYVNTAIQRSGVTPGSVDLTYNGNDFNITVVKSTMSGESFIVKGYGLGSRAEKADYSNRLSSLMRNGDFENAQKMATEAAKKYPGTPEYRQVMEKVKPIVELGAINKANPESRIFRVVEADNGFEVHDGIMPVKKYVTLEKDDFTKYLSEMVSDDVGTIYFEVSGKSNETATNFVKTMEGQLSVAKPKLTVSSVPANKNLLFETKNFSSAEKNMTMPSSRQAEKTYAAQTATGTVKFKIGLDFKASVTVAKVRKMAKSFYGYVETFLFGRKKSLNQSVIQAKKDVLRKYPELSTDQFKTFVKDELGTTNYVLFLDPVTDTVIVAIAE